MTLVALVLTYALGLPATAAIGDFTMRADPSPVYTLNAPNADGSFNLILDRGIPGSCWRYTSNSIEITGGHGSA